MDGQEVLLGRSMSSPPHLDTVRALHQTVVSLRTALELSKNELKELREKYQQHSQSNYEDTIEKLTLENHILRRKIIDTHGEDTFDVNNIKEIENVHDSSSDVVLESKCVSLQKQEEQDILEVAEVVFDETIVICETTDSEQSEKYFCTTENSNRKQISTDYKVEQSADEICLEKLESTRETKEDTERKSSYSGDELIQSQRRERDKKSFKTKLELHSKFDVSIKVRTLEGHENFVSTTTSESESTTDVEGKDCSKFRREEKITEEFTLKPASKQQLHAPCPHCRQPGMAVPPGGGGSAEGTRSGEYAVQVRVTSEESLLVERERNAAGTLHLDVDGLSVRSMSEGDNSVFSEEVEGCGGGGGVSDDEEVDDIELIFTTDESKDMSNLQEDLVSIRESEPWVPSPTKSTPVLIKFHTLDPELEGGGEAREECGAGGGEAREECGAGGKRVSLPSEREPPARAGILRSCENKSDNYLNKAGRRLESVDSLTCEERGLSFDTNKSSSFDLGSSLDVLPRHAPADTDISKCGVSEEELAGLCARRNTCPNPFQYRPLPVRPRPSGPLRARTRPILKPECGGVRRESGAQTELSALPPRWSSDGYLAHKRGPVLPPTLPSRPPPESRAPRRRVPPEPRARAPPPPHTAPRTAESRRVLLSDIGFTSMVPELSRSADPVWAAGAAAACGACGSALRSPAASPTRLAPTSTTKYLVRSIVRSPRPSTDNTYDYSCAYVPAHTTATDEEQRGTWRSSLPDVRGAPGAFGRNDTVELLDDVESFLRRSVGCLRPGMLHSAVMEAGTCGNGASGALSRPYIPTEPRHLRLGHTVKLIAPNGRIAIGTVRYVGVAGGAGEVHVGVVLAAHGACQPPNDGTLAGRRYFRAPPGHTAIFVPFSKVVMAWAN